MSFIPDFLLKKIYKKGSLRETPQGIAFDLKNLLAPAVISGVNFIKINDQIYESIVIKIISPEKVVSAHEISPQNPLRFKFNQESTLLLEGAKGLQEGLNKIILEIINPDVGKVNVTLTDNVAM